MSHPPEFVERGEPARLIPVTADSNREQRAASVVLAAMRAVFEFRQAMLSSLGIRVGSRAALQAWTEVKLKGAPEVKKDRPDGLVVLDTGKKQWISFIEAKIGASEVSEAQLKGYLQQARQHKVDAVVTISNQFVALPSHHPVKVPKSLTRGIGLYHWSWTYLLTQATLLLEGGEVSSPDQRFVLEEVVRYLRHDSSGISSFDSMNREWKDVVGKVKSGATLNRGSEEVLNTVSSWHQEQRDLCLVMSRRLGRFVKLRLSRSHRMDPQQRLRDDAEALVRNKKLRCALEIPHAASDLEVTADLAKRTLVCSMRLAAPQDKKSTIARVNWLRRQLQGVETKGMVVEVMRAGRAEDTQAPLAVVLENPGALLSSTTDVVPHAFEVFYMVDLAGRFSGSRVFIEELENGVPHFYEQVGQRLRAWVAPPPKIKQPAPALAESDRAAVSQVSERAETTQTVNRSDL